jgi:cytidine deaminase
MDVPLQDLTEDDRELIDAARAVIDANTDTQDLHGDGVHTMGAAVRDSDGRIHVGVNLAHFTGGPCAELVALGTARANGARRVEAIVAVGNHGRGVVGPCGRDRQILFDYHPGIRILLPTEAGVLATTIEALMPYAAAWTIDAGTQAFDPTRLAR